MVKPKVIKREVYMVDEKKIKSFIHKWENVEFESSSVKTPQFMEFVRGFKTAFKHAIGDTVKDIKFSVGHFYISGFLTLNNGNIIYFNIFDVRFFKNEWFNNILVRTAKSYTDYTGGSNNYCTLLNVGEKINNLW